MPPILPALAQRRGDINIGTLHAAVRQLRGRFAQSADVGDELGGGEGNDLGRSASGRTAVACERSTSSGNGEPECGQR